MSSLHFFCSRVLVTLACCVVFFYQASALDIKYCSQINTASTNANSSIYQSNGLCHDFCDSSFAFAVLQDSSCWCTDFVPATTVNGGQCSLQCPGYPQDLCGGQGLFGYIALDKAPSGTKGASSSAAASSTSQPATTRQSASRGTVLSTVEMTPSSSSSSTTSTSTSSSSTPNTNSQTPAPSSTSSSLTWTPTPVTSVQTVTGEVRTVTFTPTSPPDSAQNSAVVTQTSKKGLSTGGAVGLTIGLVALACIVGALIFWFCRRRRRREREFDNPSGGNSTLNHSPQRTMSQNSSYMLRSDGRNVVEGWTDVEPERAAGRGSRLLPVDPRLDPFAPVYQRGDGNKSHESLQTIHDNHDYSRRVHQQAPVLSVMNPD